MIVAVSRGRHRPASMPVIVGVVGVVFLALVVAGVLATRSTGSGDRSASIKALLAYETAILPATQQAGQAIVAGIRPDITDFMAGRISVQVWNLDMQTRQRELAHARAGFDHADAPDSLKDAPVWFDRAFDKYQQAVKLLLQAGTMEGTARTDLISRAASIGEAGDRAFDQGTARIQAARRAMGLGPDPRFSDKASK